MCDIEGCDRKGGHGVGKGERTLSVCDDCLGELLFYGYELRNNVEVGDAVRVEGDDERPVGR